MSNNPDSGFYVNNNSQYDELLLNESVLLKLSCEILKLFTQNSFITISKKIPSTIKSITKVSSVAICLRKQDRSLIYSNGFPKNFEVPENIIFNIQKNKNHHIRSDGKQLLTNYGSFWTNDLIRFFGYYGHDADNSECLGGYINNGYKSIAIIPIKGKSENIGLLLLFDKRSFVFDLNIIKYFENITESFALLYYQLKNSKASVPTQINYEDLFSEFPGIIIQLNVGGLIFFVSGRLSDYYSESVQELYNKNIHSFDLFNINSEHWVKLINDSINSCNSISEELKVKTIKGITFFQLKVAPKLDVNFKITSVVLTLRDITKYKENEFSFKEKQRIIHSVLDSMPIGVLIIQSATGKIVYSNEVATRFKNNFIKVSSNDNKIGSFFSSIKATDIHGENYDLTENSLNSIINHGKKIRKHLNLYNNDGERLVVNFSYTRIKNSHGNIVAGAITFVNITDIVKLKSEYTEFRDKFKTLFDLCPEGCAIITFSDGVLLDVNKSCLEMFGFTKEEVIRKRVQDLGIGVDNKLIDELFTPVKQGKNIANTHLKLKKKTGAFFDIEVFADGLYYAGSYCIFCIVKDISENINLLDKLKQNEKMSAIGQLVGGVAHDFNNQLTGILGYSDFLVEQLEDPDLKKYAENIATCAVRSADLTEKLLAFSRKSECKSIPIDIHKLLPEVINMLEHSIDKKITIGSKFNAKLSTTVGDPSQLQNALLNLAINARDAISDDVGMISFITESVVLDREFCVCSNFDIEPGKYISLKVKDTGSGMNDEIMGKIFEPFFTTKDVGKGTGMGLAAVFSTVQQHNGAIEVKSKLGYGTTFELFLPEVVDNTIEEIPSKKVKGKGHILLVDDEEIVRIIGTQMLVELGYTVTVCVNGYEAVGFFEDNYRDIDLVILDMIMPKMRGREAFINMKKIDKNVKVLITSGYAEGSEIQDVVDMGVVGIIKKPFYVEELSELINEVVNK